MTSHKASSIVSSARAMNAVKPSHVFALSLHVPLVLRVNFDRYRCSFVAVAFDAYFWAVVGKNNTWFIAPATYDYAHAAFWCAIYSLTLRSSVNKRQLDRRQNRTQTANVLRTGMFCDASDRFHVWEGRFEWQSGPLSVQRTDPQRHKENSRGSTHWSFLVYMYQSATMKRTGSTKLLHIPSFINFEREHISHRQFLDS